MSTPQPQQQQVSILSNVKWEYLVCGTLGGTAATLIFHPLELIKIRYQVNEQSKPKLFNYFTDKPTPTVTATATTTTTTNTATKAPVYRPQYRNLLDTLVKIYKTENGVRGLYRGLSINLMASGSAWGIYFFIYNGLKSHRKTQSQVENASLLGYTADATLAGMLTISITNPLFLIKTRMCLQYSQVQSSQYKYTNSLDALRYLLKHDGPKGLYKGLLPGYFGTINGTIQMVTYDNMKYWYLKYLQKSQPETQQLDSWHYLVFSGLSKCSAVVATYPFQLVRARLQDQYQTYSSIFSVIRFTFRTEGLVGFYKGLVPCLIRVTPAAAVTFLIYENLLNFLLNK